MYNPKVFGKPEVGEVGIWLAYWPIGSMLKVGDKVDVVIAVMSGLEVHECGVSLVYTDDEVDTETLENNMDFNGDLSGFQLSTGAYYLCRRDFYELMEVGRLNPNWFRILVGDTIDYTEVRGWRKTGQQKQVNPSFTELKTVRYIIDGPELEDIYKIAEMSKSSLGDKTVVFTSSFLEEEMKSVTRSEFIDAQMEEIFDKEYLSDDDGGPDFISTSFELLMENYDTNPHILHRSVQDEITEEKGDTRGEVLKCFCWIQPRRIKLCCGRKKMRVTTQRLWKCLKRMFLIRSQSLKAYKRH